MRLLLLMLSGLLLLGCQPAHKPPKPYQWPIPAGFPEPLVPEDNPMSEAKVALGRALFYDKGLSANGTQACADCHQQQFAFAEQKTLAVGSTGEVNRRNSMALVNIAYNGHFTWAHSGLASIEAQLLIPMFGEQPVELGITGKEEQVLQRFQQGQYPKLANAAFGTSHLSYDQIVKALASFVRSLLSFNSDFDRYAYQGSDNAMSESALRGMELFFSERLECFHCHGGLNFSQANKHQGQTLDLRPFHHTGLLEAEADAKDLGLYEVTLEERDKGLFRAPTLRNIALTAPYMHDGSVTTLAQVIDFYAAGGRGEGRNSPRKSPFVKGFALSESDKQDLLTFLQALTDRDFVSNPDHGAP